MDYALWAAAWSTAGAILGLFGANWYMERFKRQSVIVICLTVVLAISVVGVPLAGSFELKGK